MAEKTDKKMSREQKKELEYKENRKHWLAEEKKIYELRGKPITREDRRKMNAFTKRAKNRLASLSNSSSIRARNFSS